MDLAEEEPFAAVVSADKLSFTCSACFETADDKPYNRCSRCKFVCYCSSKCQKNDWIDHKLECQSLMRCSPRVPTPLARLIARIVWKLARGDEGTAFNGRKFADLINNKKEVEKDPIKADFYVSLCHVLFAYMGAESVPKPQVIMDIFGKIISNCFAITDWQMTQIGEGLYIGLSAHDHSCVPDAHVIFNGSKATLRCPHPQSGMKYSKDLKIRYVPLFLTTKERKKRLKEQYYFECTCVLCQDKERDAIARSVVCNRCSEGVCPVDESFLQLVCSSCAQISPIQVDDAIQYNLEVSWQMERINKSEDLNEQLTSLVKVYDKLSSKLSHLNMELALLACDIQKLAVNVNAVSLAARFAVLPLSAYNRFLARGNPELTIYYLMAALALTLENPPNPRTLQLFTEAKELSLLSHGLRSTLTAEIDVRLVVAKKRLYS